MITFTLEDLIELRPCTNLMVFYTSSIETDDLYKVLIQLSNEDRQWAMWLVKCLLSDELNKRLIVFLAMRETNNDKRLISLLISAKNYLDGKISRRELLFAKILADIACDEHHSISSTDDKTMIAEFVAAAMTYVYDPKYCFGAFEDSYLAYEQVVFDFPSEAREEAMILEVVRLLETSNTRKQR